MTEIDSAAFEAGVAPCNFTAGRIDSADESDVAHFSAALGRIYITAQALLLSARPQAGHTQPALTLVVEDSANGSSWATVATFDFIASDQQSAAVDSPRAYLRASWADVVGVWAVDVGVKSIATPASGGGSTPYTPPTDRCWFTGNNVSILNDGLELITWDIPIFDQTLLDTTDPTLPVVAEAGIYAVSVSVEPAEALTADGFLMIELALDAFGDSGAEVHGESRLQSAALVGYPAAFASLTYYIPAGSAIRVKCRNKDGAATRNVALVDGIVQRVT